MFTSPDQINQNLILNALTEKVQHCDPATIKIESDYNEESWSVRLGDEQLKVELTDPYGHSDYERITVSVTDANSGKIKTSMHSERCWSRHDKTSIDYSRLETLMNLLKRRSEEFHKEAAAPALDGLRLLYAGKTGPEGSSINISYDSKTIKLEFKTLLLELQKVELPEVVGVQAVQYTGTLRSTNQNLNTAWFEERGAEVILGLHEKYPSSWYGSWRTLEGATARVHELSSEQARKLFEKIKG